MSKSRFKKTKLASVLLLSTVLLPNIAYAEEQGDDVETEVNSEEQVYIEEEEDQSTFDDNTNINMSAQNEREPVEDDGEDGGSLLEPVDPVEPGEDTEDIINDNEDESADVVEGPEGEEETPGATPETTDPEPADPEPDEEESDIPEIPEVPTDPIDPVEPDPEPEVPEEPTQPVEPEEPVDPPYEPEPEPEVPVDPEVPVEPELSDDGGNEEDVEETETSTEEETMGTGSGPKKIYRYNHGDILNGIKFDYNNIEDDMATLDQRVTRIMSSQIIEEKDLTEAQRLELEEEAKKTTAHGAEELPDTGEANIPNYAVIGMLSIVGGMLLLLSQKLKTDN